MNFRRNFILLFLVFYYNLISGQQLTVDTSISPEELVSYFSSANCIIATNGVSTLNGSINGIDSFGVFDKGSSSFPLSNGIVLSTGSAYSSGNVLNTEPLSDGNLDWLTDPDIVNSTGISQTLNATNLQFQYTSVDDIIVFKYVFASDEYQEDYPCNFSDVFAILIRESGSSNPYTNIAQVEDTNTIVSTSTIRPQIGTLCNSQNESYFAGYNQGDTNFDGNTVVMTSKYNIQPGTTYDIKFVIADHIDERFDSAVFIDIDTYNDSVDLGPDRTLCGNDHTLDATINNPNATYAWYLNNNVIPNENNPIIPITNSGIYEIEITIPTSSGLCTINDTVTIDFVPFQVADFITNINVCDPEPSDGIYDFDFTALKNEEIYSNLPSENYSISYHLSQVYAQNNINPIEGIYQNSEQTETIFVRIESNDGDCLQVGSFNISIFGSPDSTAITVNICNNTLSDVATVNINILDPQITDFGSSSEVSYYLNQEDAINQVNQLYDYPNFTDSTPYMIARVDDIFTDCYTLEFVYFNYLTSPDLGIDEFIIDACLSPDHYQNEGSVVYTYEDAPVTFNLEDAILEVQEVFPGANVRILAPILGNPRLFTLTSPVGNLPIGISFDDAYCEEVISLQLHKNVLFNTIEDGKIIYGCDDSSNNGIVDFNFSEITEELRDGVPNIDFTFYESESDRDNAVNPINQLSPYTITTPTKEIFVTSSYQGSCSYNSKILLSIVRAPEVTPKIVQACGTLDESTNTTSIDLLPFIDEVSQGLFFVNVTFHETMEDAENDTNSIESIDVTGNLEELYFRVTDDNTDCFSVSTLVLNVLDSIEIAPPQPIIACDDDQDGFEVVNLESVISGFPIDPDEFEIQFYQTYDTAVDERYPIQNPENYNTQSQSVYIRLQRPSLDCFNILELQVQVYETPRSDEIPNYSLCEMGQASTSEFFLSTKDEEIISGQDFVTVAYFESSDDATNNDNPIDKEIAYTNTSNPQTIYVRKENSQEPSCFVVLPLILEVKQAPIFTEPSDILECDIDNNSQTEVNFNLIRDEINSNTNQSLKIDFFETYTEAELNQNSLFDNYTTITNPQVIYVRVENTESSCYEITEFLINDLALPEINDNQTLNYCYNDAINEIVWNLRDIELKILEGRQYNIEFIFFESEDDLIADSNPIENPEEYFTENVEESVIFVKVLNIGTGCYDYTSFNLVVEYPPEVNDISYFNFCENENSLIDLSLINQDIVDDSSNIEITYYNSQIEAEQKYNQLDTIFNYLGSTEVYVRVEYYESDCYTVRPIELIINTPPTANQASPLSICEEDLIYPENLEPQRLQILGNQNQDDHTITFYNTESDAELGINQLMTPAIPVNGNIIYARIENNTTNCHSVTQFETIVHPLPLTDIPQQTICPENFPLVVSAETGFSGDTYLWSTNETSPEIEITAIGTYSVTVTTEFGCSVTSTFNVIESEPADIDVVEVIDFSDPNNITITVTGIGDYLYQLDDFEPQTSNFFENVGLGYHTLTIIDRNGCSSVTREVLVIDAPKFFTPNNDGDFDTWHITGAETLPGTVVNIFDRYGKLLKQLFHYSKGWDGTYNGHQMPVSDYWFSAEVQRNGITFTVNGHFSLKR